MGNTIVVLHSAQSANDLFDKCSSIYSDRTQSPMVAHEELYVIPFLLLFTLPAENIFTRARLNWSNSVPLTRYGERFRAYRRIFNSWLNKTTSTTFHARQVFQTRQLLNRLLGYEGKTMPSELLESEFQR
jgi:hypothetical protein